MLLPFSTAWMFTSELQSASRRLAAPTGRIRRRALKSPESVSYELRDHGTRSPPVQGAARADDSIAGATAASHGRAASILDPIDVAFVTLRVRTGRLRPRSDHAQESARPAGPRDGIEVYSGCCWGCGSQGRQTLASLTRQLRRRRTRVGRAVRSGWLVPAVTPLLLLIELLAFVELSGQ